MGPGPIAIFVMDADGSNAKPLVKAPDILNHGDPQYSHDGKWIAFSGNTATLGRASSDICIVSSDGDLKTLKRIGVGRRPRWSPDDKKVLFMTRAYEDDNPGVYVMDADGGNRVRLCDGEWPSWSPDGAKVAVIDRDAGSVNLFVVTLAGRKPLLDQSYQFIPTPTWSPNGKYLAFIGMRDGAWELAIVSARGSQKFFRVRYRDAQQRRIGFVPSWSPDGKRLVIWIKDINNADRLHVINPHTEDEPVLLKNQEGTYFNSDAAWSPDSKKIIFVSDREFK
jgi:TolB protein